MLNTPHRPSCISLIANKLTTVDMYVIVQRISHGPEIPQVKLIHTFRIGSFPARTALTTLIYA